MIKIFKRNGVWYEDLTHVGKADRKSLQILAGVLDLNKKRNLGAPKKKTNQASAIEGGTTMRPDPQPQ